MGNSHAWWYARTTLSHDKVLWVRKPHTAAKHSILRHYLEAWFPKLAWTRRVFFVDGFAGPGEYAGGEPGSPIIALNAALQHKGDLSKCELLFMFVERDADRFRQLQDVLQRIDTKENVKFQALQGEFANHFGNILDRLESERKNLAPSFIMVDPFGFTGMPFELIGRAAAQPRSEFLISFMYDSIVRWRNQPDHEQTFDVLFGCPDWRRADGVPTPADRKAFLLDLYLAQLRSCGMDYVRSFELLDSGNRTEYFLVFATHSIDGLKAMKAAMWKVDPTGRYQFSDATVSSQLTLFATEPDYVQLKALLLGRFAGQAISISAIEEFVVADTAFRESHYKRQILAPMEREGELTVVRSPRKMRYRYPLGTIIKFD